MKKNKNRKQKEIEKTKERRKGKYRSLFFVFLFDKENYRKDTEREPKKVNKEERRKGTPPQKNMAVKLSLGLKTRSLKCFIFVTTENSTFKYLIIASVLT